MKTKLSFSRNWAIAITLVTLGLVVAVPLFPVYGWTSLASKILAPQPAPQELTVGELLENTYIGTAKLNWAVPGIYSDTLTAPEGELPDLGSVDLGFLTHCSGGNLNGYVDLGTTLIFPKLDEITTAEVDSLGVGPSISGTCSDSLYILSESFEQKTGAGQRVKRQFQLIGTLVAPNTYSGEYRETLWGYGPQPFTIVGDFKLLSVNPDSNVPDTQTFDDVLTDYWAWSYIERLYASGITSGCGTNPLIYCPEASVTRGQIAVFLEKGMHYPDSFIPPDVAPTFGDTLGHWAKDWIEALKSDGITAGCGSGNYCPENPVTRAQMAIFLLKAKYGSSYTPPDVGDASGFADVTTDHWAAAWIKQLAAEGITGGCGGGNYCPESPVTRAQMAVFLVKAFNLP